MKQAGTVHKQKCPYCGFSQQADYERCVSCAKNIKAKADTLQPNPDDVCQVGEHPLLHYDEPSIAIEDLQGTVQPLTDAVEFLTVLGEAFIPDYTVGSCDQIGKAAEQIGKAALSAAKELAALRAAKERVLDDLETWRMARAMNDWETGKSEGVLAVVESVEACFEEAKGENDD